MAGNNSPALGDDQRQIENLLIRWGHARDSDDWEALAQCFHDDATIHISWISGPAQEFVARSRAMAQVRKPGHHIKHLIAGPWIRIGGKRAFSRCHVNLYIRAIFDGHEFDLRSWSRFFDLLEKRDGVWRIVKRTAVYEKDRMDAVDPRGVPKEFFAAMNLSSYPPATRFLCYSIARSGRTPSSGIVSAFSKEERSLKAEGEAWLENA